jgi:hypothetical protein
MTDTGWERRVQRLEAEREIVALAARYCHGADDEDVDAFLAVWEPDAHWDVGAHRFEGLTEIEAAVRRQWDAAATMLHATANSTIEFDDDDLARGRHDVISVVVFRTGRRMLTTGRYEDVYSRGATGWRIRERRAIVSSTSELTESGQ